PEKTMVNIDLLGNVEITKDHVISLQNDVDTQYQAYIEVQNELVAAYNELRNEFSMQKFGKKYDELPEREQMAIQQVYPQKISEAEPKNYGGIKNGKN
ncbi:MAG: biopolymer transporter ExbD, partial [Paludibacter sp.]